MNKCVCTIDIGINEIYDTCVFDSGKIDECDNAIKLSENGLGKLDCKHWEIIATDSENYLNNESLKDKRIAELEQRLAEIEAKLPRWIPVKERLPKPGATILAVDVSKDMGVCTFVNAKFVGECFGFEVYLNDGGWDRSPSKVIGEYVTHWMPLLEPPESGSEGE